MAAADTPFFLETGARGQRLCVHYPSFHDLDGAPALGQVLLLPPFAEEMNKSRRMTALAARAFAGAGLEVLTLDLLGCGDSSGDFGDATWTDWQDDVRLAVNWLNARARPGPDGQPVPLWLWGVRAGALLAGAGIEALSAAAPDRPVHLLLWQPITTGKLQLQQFMRLRVAADLIGGQAKGAVQAMRDQLARGESVEIAGYALAPALADGLEAAKLTPTARVSRVAWLELSTREDAALTPAATMAAQAWTAQGAAVRAAVCQGPSFWAATEIEEAPRLIEASLAAMAARDDFATTTAEAVPA